jgi:ornithine decarboxylase
VEIQLALDAGATPDRISFGNTIKKERDIARALELGVRLFAVDCEAEVEKIARAAALTGAEGVKVFCRILCDCVGAEWPLSRKFGCAPEMAVDVLEYAHRLGLEAYGVSFHVGSQQRNTESWDVALASASSIFRECAERGIHLSMVNLGGGFPTKYLKSVPAVEAYGESIFRALSKHFGNRLPETIIEPGRRQGPDRRHGRLHDHLLGGRLQRLPAAEELRDLIHVLPAPDAPGQGQSQAWSRTAGSDT